MFEWLTEMEKPVLPIHDEYGELEIDRVYSDVDLNEMSEVFQLFASFDVILDENALTSFPTPNEMALNTIMNEVVPHYLDIKKIFIDGKLKAINVRCLKEESKKMVEDLLSNGVYPVIPDLFRTKNLNLATEPRKLKYYKVNQELISLSHIKETEKVRDLFKSSFFAENGSISLQPTGWKLEDNLKESVTIRTVSTFAKQIVLLVDDKDMSVVGLDIYGEL